MARIWAKRGLQLAVVAVVGVDLNAQFPLGSTDVRPLTLSIKNAHA